MRSAESIEALGVPARPALQARAWVRAGFDFVRAKPLGALGAVIILSFLILAIFAPSMLKP